MPEDYTKLRHRIIGRMITLEYRVSIFSRDLKALRDLVAEMERAKAAQEPEPVAAEVPHAR